MVQLVLVDVDDLVVSARKTVDRDALRTLAELATTYRVALTTQRSDPGVSVLNPFMPDPLPWAGVGLLSERAPLAKQISSLLSSVYEVDPAECVIVLARPDRSRELRESPARVIRVGTPGPDHSNEQVISSLTDLGPTLAAI